MVTWAAIAAAYGLVLAVASLQPRQTRRQRLLLLSLTFIAASLMVSQVRSPTVQLLGPGVVLLAGYWLSGLFTRAPNLTLERWLLASDARVFQAIGRRNHVVRLPRSLLEMLEACYAADYVVVGGSVLLLAPEGPTAIARYWTMVLGAAFVCYASLPWLRTRPPRVLEGPQALDQRRLFWRRVNTALLDRASVQANTIPSGHVAAAVAAAAAVLVELPLAGTLLMAVAMLIGVAAFVGRYHYAADVLLGALTGAAALLLI